MNTNQLYCAINCDKEMKSKIIGVYAADNIPRTLHTLPYGFIVNTDPHHLPGKHWIACFINENCILELFDSYGNLPEKLSPYIKQYVNSFERYLTNNKRLQSSDTRVCGQYCLHYFMSRCRGHSMKNIIDIFSDNFEQNDQFVYDFVEERYYCCMDTSKSVCQSCICMNKII